MDKLTEATDLTEMFALLRQLGLPGDAAILYSQLVVDGEASVEALASETGLGEARATQGLRILLKANLVMRSAHRRKELLQILSPAVAFNVFRTYAYWSRPSRTRLEESEQEPVVTLERLSEIREATRQLTVIVKRLSGRKRLSRRSLPVTNAREMSRLLADEIAQSSRIILAIDPAPNAQDSALIWGSLEARITAGVEYRRICTFEELLLQGLEIKRDDITLRGVKLAVLEGNKIDDKFYIIDDRSVVAFERGEDANRFGLVGHVFQNRHIARRLRNRFERYAAAAMPGLFVLDELDRCAQELIEQATENSDPAVKEIVECIVRRGQFCRPQISQGRWNYLISAAAAAGFITKPGRRAPAIARIRFDTPSIRHRWTTLTQGLPLE